MIQKMIAMLMLMSGSAMVYASATDSNDLAGSHVIASNFGVATRVKWHIGELQPFWVHGKSEFNSVSHQQLLFITDKKSGSLSQEVERLETALTKLPQEHTDTDIEVILKNAADSTAHALYVLVNDKRIVMSHKGVKSKALVILREGMPATITEDACDESAIKRLAYMASYKGVVFMRDMSLTDAQINEIVTTTLMQENKTPRDVAKALVNADNGESVAAAYFDYDIFNKDQAAVHRSPTVVMRRSARSGKKGGCCPVQ